MTIVYFCREEGQGEGKGNFSKRSSASAWRSVARMTERCGRLGGGATQAGARDACLGRCCGGGHNDRPAQPVRASLSGRKFEGETVSMSCSVRGTAKRARAERGQKQPRGSYNRWGRRVTSSANAGFPGPKMVCKRVGDEGLIRRGVFWAFLFICIVWGADC